jgi:hypothetical protein
MAKTLEQQIAEAEAKLNRLRERERKKDTRRKIIVGGLLISEALASPAGAQKLLRLIEQKVTRDVDKTDIAPLVDELRAVAAKGGTEAA